MSALRHHLPRIIEEQNPGVASHGDCDYEIYTSKFHDLICKSFESGGTRLLRKWACVWLTWCRLDPVRRRGGRARGGLAGAFADQRCGAGGAGALRHRDGRDVRGAHRLRHRRYVSLIAENERVCVEREEEKRPRGMARNVQQEAGKHLLSLLSGAPLWRPSIL